MVVSRRIIRGDTTVVVESHAEVLFMPGGKVNNWHKRFTGQIREKTRSAAPKNKRPRWAHYGPPLKATIHSAKPAYWGNGRDRQRIYGAVGSNSPYALYVNDGTGVFGGNGPYRAKILPPWVRGGSSLYEHTWRPSGEGGRRVAPVMIQGQPGQRFFERGLALAFRHMRLRSYQVAGEPRISATAAGNNVWNSGMAGNTPVSNAFVMELALWRIWRDEAWDSGHLVGRNEGRMSEEERLARADYESKYGRQQREKMRRRDERGGLSKEEFIRQTKEADERRAREAREKIAADEERKRIGREKAEADKRKRQEEIARNKRDRAVAAAYQEAVKEAHEYANLMRKEYPDAHVLRADKAKVARVEWTDHSGDVWQMDFSASEYLED